jgi:hypothetical protein
MSEAQEAPTMPLAYAIGMSLSSLFYLYIPQTPSFPNFFARTRAALPALDRMAHRGCGGRNDIPHGGTP